MVCAARPPRSRRSATPEGRRSFGFHAWAFAKELTAVVVGAIIVSSLLRAFVGQMFVIPSESMQNTLLKQDRVVVLKIGSLKRGQVVVFENPGGWLNGTQAPERGTVGRALEFVGVLPDSGTEHLIKRLVGLPGDHVVCCDARGRITVNGYALDERAYLYTAPDGREAAPSTIPFDVTVPAGRIFVLGDNRENSRDSRCHLRDSGSGSVRGENAFVAEDLVVGHTVAVAWPLDRFATLDRPTTYASVPAAAAAPARAVVHAGPEADC